MLLQEHVSVTIVGSGNMAWHLGNLFLEKGYEIVEVISRNETQGKALADELETEYKQLGAPFLPAQLYLLCVADSAITDIANFFKDTNALVAHTSGSVDINALKNVKNPAIFYPLQSLTKNRRVDFKDVPILVECLSEDKQDLLWEIAASLVKNVFDVTSEERRFLHISAVMVSNFTNSLYLAAQQLLEENTRLPFSLLNPLMAETALKAIQIQPFNAQTGPAKRGDIPVMELHLGLLKKYPDLADIYQRFSTLIQQQQNK